MALNTYAGLQTSIAGWIKRADLTAQIPDFIDLGEKWIYRAVKTREMEKALSVTISSGVASIPSDFIQLKACRISGNPDKRLEIRPPDWIYDNYPVRSSTAKPGFIGVEGSNFVFGPYPDSNYSITGTYYANLGQVSSTEHALFAAAYDLYLFAALCEAEPYVKNDQRLLVWQSKRDSIAADMNRRSRESRMGDGMSVRAA